MVRVDVRHERVPGAVHALADDATVLFLSLGVLVGDVTLEGGLRAQHLTTELAREHLLGRCPCNSKTKLAMVHSGRVATSRVRTRGRGPGPPPPSHHVTCPISKNPPNYTEGGGAASPGGNTCV